MKERICCVCRKKQAAGGLLRVARFGDEFAVDQCGNANGRGAYVCPGCVDVAVSKRALNRSFRRNVPNEVYEKLIAIKNNNMYNR